MSVKARLTGLERKRPATEARPDLSTLTDGELDFLQGLAERVCQCRTVGAKKRFIKGLPEVEQRQLAAIAGKL